jgi:hypothetical protein
LFNDYKQTVATFNNLVIADEFSVNGAPNSKMWGYDIGTGSNGWGNGGTILRIEQKM